MHLRRKSHREKLDLIIQNKKRQVVPISPFHNISPMHHQRLTSYADNAHLIQDNYLFHDSLMKFLEIHDHGMHSSQIG